jgi:hypothetical protein
VPVALDSDRPVVQRAFGLPDLAGGPRRFLEGARDAGSSALGQARDAGSSALGQARDAGSSAIDRAREAGTSALGQASDIGSMALAQARGAGSSALGQARDLGSSALAQAGEAGSSALGQANEAGSSALGQARDLVRRAPTGLPAVPSPGALRDAIPGVSQLPSMPSGEGIAGSLLGGAQEALGGAPTLTPQSDAGAGGAPGEGDSSRLGEREIQELLRKLYPRLRHHLASEFLVARERAGALTDLR